LIENGIDLMRGSDLNGVLAFTGMEPEPTVGTCAICGRQLTQVGPKGECFVVSLIWVFERQPRTRKI